MRRDRLLRRMSQRNDPCASLSRERVRALVPFSRQCSVVSAVVEVVAAFVGREVIEQGSQQRIQSVDTSGLGAAEEPFEFREHQFNRVQVGTVRGQLDDLRSRRFDGLADTRHFVRRQVVQDHPVAGHERGHELLTHRGPERDPVHRAIDHGRCREPVDPQRRHEGRRFPVAVRQLGNESRATTTATIRAGPIGFGPSFIDEHQPLGVQSDQLGFPRFTPRRDVGPVLLGRMHDFF